MRNGERGKGEDAGGEGEDTGGEGEDAARVRTRVARAARAVRLHLDKEKKKSQRQNEKREGNAHTKSEPGGDGSAGTVMYNPGSREKTKIKKKKISKGGRESGRGGCTNGARLVLRPIGG